MKFATPLLAAALLAGSALVPAFSCTRTLYVGDDHTVLTGRNMDWKEDMQSNLYLFPAGMKRDGASGPKSIAWTAKYGSVIVAGYEAGTTDGLNEKGLHVGGFFFPGYAQYENVAEADYPSTISCLEVASWILANCSSVAEAREQLPKIHVSSVAATELGYSPPLHMFISDKSGDAAIVEYVAGKLNIYDNKVNVITNSPDYIWQTANLRNYIGIEAANKPAITINGNQFAQFGQGSGAIGLPGDFTPPSRFVRAVFLVNTALQGKNIDEGIAVAFHILNQFDIPLGAVKGEQDGVTTYDTTQWTCASDLTNSRYFYHTYNDRSVRMIDLKELDLNAADVKVVKVKDVQKPGQVKDVSAELK